ncbi:MAG: cytochrome c peroxidase [Spirosomataceae bacterium]
MLRINYLLGAVGLVLLLSFRLAEEQPLFQAPSHFPKPTYHFASNPLSTDGIALGKTLFYDALLSKDNTVSCASCHQQSAGFTQHGHALSHGINDLLTKRNSMPLFNLAWSKDFGWDGGVHDLDLFPVSPLQNPAEMDETLANVLDKLRSTKQYPPLFEKAFGSTEINSERFLKALSQFMLTMVSANSRYDKFISQGEPLSETEQKGMKLFEQKCTSCHAGVLFSDFSHRNNGLKAALNTDVGRYDVTLNESDRYKFKVPSLRNLAFTAPYMHDGRLGTLEEVLDHYDSGVEDSPSLDPLLKQNGRLGIALSKDEKAQIIAFLNTLNDESFIKEARFAEYAPAPVEAAFANYTDADWEKADLKVSNEALKNSFRKMLGYYFDIKNAMGADNGTEASKAAALLLNLLDNLNKSLLSPVQKAFYEKIYEELSFNTEHISETQSVQHQRDHFGDVSKDLRRLLKAFQVIEKPLYYVHCTKASPSQAGYWISEKSTDTINPFFGKNSAKCGKTESSPW